MLALPPPQPWAAVAMAWMVDVRLASLRSAGRDAGGAKMRWAAAWTLGQWMRRALDYLPSLASLIRVFNCSRARGSAAASLSRKFM